MTSGQFSTDIPNSFTGALWNICDKTTIKDTTTSKTRLCTRDLPCEI